MKELGSVSDYLDTCEERVRQGDSTSTNIRADAKEGLIIDFAKEKERRRKLAEMTQRHSDELARARSYSAGTETVAVKKEAEGAVKGEIPAQDNYVHDMAAGACLRDRRQPYCHARIFPLI